MKHTLYFAYGSNMDPRQMRRRCPSAKPLGPAALPGWRLAFGGHSSTWGGPVATVVRDAEVWVDGVLYRLPFDDLTELDRYEGHPHVYRRIRLLVEGDQGQPHRAHVYVLAVDEEEAPASEYLKVLRRAYRRLGFDPGRLLATTGDVR